MEANPLRAGGHRSEPRELRARGRNTKRRLLDAGAAVLAAKGYHATRVDDVVKVAETSHGTFYLYFSNKEELFRALAAEVATRCRRCAEALAPLRAGAAGRAELEQWIKEFVEVYRRNGPVIRAWTEAEIGGSEFGRLGTDLLTQFTGVVVGRISEVAPPGADPTIATLVLVAMLERLNYYALDEPGAHRARRGRDDARPRHARRALRQLIGKVRSRRDRRPCSQLVGVGAMDPMTVATDPRPRSAPTPTAEAPARSRTERRPLLPLVLLLAEGLAFVALLLVGGTASGRIARVAIATTSTALAIASARHGGRRASVVLVTAGIAGVTAGAGVGVMHVVKHDVTPAALAALVTLVIGLALFATGVVELTRAAPGWWRLLAIPGVYVVLQFVVLPLTVAVYGTERAAHGPRSRHAGRPRPHLHRRRVHRERRRTPVGVVRPVAQRRGRRDAARVGRDPVRCARSGGRARATGTASSCSTRAATGAAVATPTSSAGTATATCAPR